MGRLRLGLLVFVFSCGTGESVTGGDGGKDAADGSIGFVVDAGDAGADVEIDSGRPCAEGDFHLEVTNASGTTVLANGCGDASAPFAEVVDPCLDCESVEISACNASETFALLAMIFPTSDPVGTWTPSNVSRTDADGGQCRWDAKITIFDWPDAGGTVKGEYAAYATGACSGDTSLVSGHFCVQRR